MKRRFVDLQISVGCLIECRQFFIRALDSVTVYVFLFFRSWIQSPHYTADMAHHIKCDHGEKNQGTADYRQLKDEAHMPSISVK